MAEGCAGPPAATRLLPHPGATGSQPAFTSAFRSVWVPGGEFERRLADHARSPAGISGAGRGASTARLPTADVHFSPGWRLEV